MNNHSKVTIFANNQGRYSFHIVSFLSAIKNCIHSHHQRNPNTGKRQKLFPKSWYNNPHIRFIIPLLILIFFIIFPLFVFRLKCSDFSFKPIHAAIKTHYQQKNRNHAKVNNPCDIMIIIFPDSCINCNNNSINSNQRRIE